MKRVWIACLLLLILVVSGIWNQHFIQSTVTEVTQELDAAAQAQQKQQSNQTIRHLRSAQNLFEKKRGYLSLVLSHQSLDLITLNFDRIIHAANNRDAEDFGREHSELKIRLSLLPESERLSIPNLF